MVNSRGQTVGQRGGTCHGGDIPTTPDFSLNRSIQADLSGGAAVLAPHYRTIVMTHSIKRRRKFHRQEQEFKDRIKSINKLAVKHTPIEPQKVIISVN